MTQPTFDAAIDGCTTPPRRRLALVFQTLDAQDRSAVRHQVTATAQMPGVKGMWVGICLEFIEFAVFFAVYFVSRWHYPEEFQRGAAKLWTTGGVAVTLAMVSSGYFLTQSIARIKAGNAVQSRRWLLLAMGTGLLYPVVKVLEWQWNAAHGIDVSAGIFVVVYYYLTINHFIHACWGLVGMAWGLLRFQQGAYSREDHHGLEAIATYWHATDIVWLMLFALFYAFA